MRDKPESAQVYAVQAAPAKAKKKPNILMRLLAFLLTVTLMLGAVVLVVYRDKINFDAVVRYFSYRSLEITDSGQVQSFPHEGSARDSFVSVNGNLLACSAGGVRLYSGSGTKYAARQIALAHPVSSAAGIYSLVYDAGGKDLFLFKDKEQVFSSGAEGGNPILSARVNPSGRLAITTQATGYKGSVTVYGTDFQPTLQLNLSSSFITDALVSRSDKSLVTITMSQGSSGFESKLSLYTLARAAGEALPDAECSLSSNVVLDLAESTAGFWALGDADLSLVGHDGTLTGTYDYNGRYLKEFSLAGDDFAALLLGKYRAGTLADLVVVDGKGVESARLSMNEQVLSLSAAGRYLAVLTADRLDIYTSDLTLYSSLEGIQGARKVLQRSDGTAMLISDETARLYLPT